MTANIQPFAVQSANQLYVGNQTGQGPNGFSQFYYELRAVVFGNPVGNPPSVDTWVTLQTGTCELSASQDVGLSSNVGNPTYITSCIATNLGLTTT